jgi:stage III sporulation protein AG
LNKERLNKLKGMFIKQDGDGKKPPYRNIAILFLAGILLMISSLFINRGDETENTTNAVFETASKDVNKEAAETFGSAGSKKAGTIASIEKAYESELKDTLETMSGVSDVSVIVNVDSTEEKVYEKNAVSQHQITEETDRDGGERKVEDFSTDEKVVVIREGDKEVPLIQQTKKPTIRGVLIVAKGAGNMSVKKEIVEAVTRVLDVPSHRVAVSAKK